MQIVQNNVVGQGIALQSQVKSSRGKLQNSVNDQIETAWMRWCNKQSCHVAGLMGMTEILRLIMGQQVEAGEVLLRKVRQPFGGSKIPYALEVIEADRLMDQWQTARAPNGNSIRMGVEIDKWGRPVAYWLYPTHPGDYQFTTFVPSAFIRVPADEIIHPYLIERWPQTRGVPWFHSVLARLHNMAGYEEAEIVAARAAANIVGFIKTPDTSLGDAVVNNQRVIDTTPGQFQTLLPGEDFTGFAPGRPNAALEPFMRYMLRSMAAGVGVSYESLSRDYSQSNYSSSRLALLDDRDLWRMLQGWLIRNVLDVIFKDWLESAVLAGELLIPDFYSNRQKYESARFKPRGWSWIDPTKEVIAYKLAVRSGFMTVSDVIGLTGGGADAEDVFKARRGELDMMSDLDLIFDTDVSQVDDKGMTQVKGSEPAPETDTPGEQESAATGTPAADDPEGAGGTEEDTTQGENQ